MTASADKPAAAGPKVGAKVASFTAESTGGPLKLADLKGRKVVLYFYPKDNTPGCTTEGADFAASHAQFRAADAEVFGVSRDSIRSHAGFKEKLGFPFELISDPDEALCNQFGVMKMKNMYASPPGKFRPDTEWISGRG